MAQTDKRAMRLAIVGAGWAGLAAAVEAADLGADVTVFEATRAVGGRARSLGVLRPDGLPLTLDNGQHILIGAYTHTLAMMQRVGMQPGDVLHALPLGLPYPDGTGLRTPGWAVRWPSPWNVLAAMVTARGWSWRDRLGLLRTSLGWQRRRFVCESHLTVDQLCAGLPERAMNELIEPLCVSALNLPAAQASGQVFLRVMRDALMGKGFADWSGSSLLLPRTDLSSLFPSAAVSWLQAQHGETTRVRLGTRVHALNRSANGWRLSGDGWQEDFDQVVWATGPGPASQAVSGAAVDVRQAGELQLAEQMDTWSSCASALKFTAITTVYAWSPGTQLSAPMLALRADPDAHAAPAQFVFDRGQLNPRDPALQGVLAFVVSASEGERNDLQARVLQQAERQLGLTGLQVIQTVVEKRATFACTPNLERPPQPIAPGLQAAGDYVQGPYPATLEGAVRSALADAAADD